MEKSLLASLPMTNFDFPYPPWFSGEWAHLWPSLAHIPFIWEKFILPLVYIRDVFCTFQLKPSEVQWRLLWIFASLSKTFKELKTKGKNIFRLQLQHTKQAFNSISIDLNIPDSYSGDYSTLAILTWAIYLILFASISMWEKSRTLAYLMGFVRIKWDNLCKMLRIAIAPIKYRKKLFIRAYFSSPTIKLFLVK